MRRALTIWILAAVMIASFGPSCKKSFSSSQFVEDKLVILSEISANDSIKVPVGKSIRVGNGNLIRFDKVNDARVQLKEATGTAFMLRVNYSSQYASNPSSIYSSRRRLRANTTYSIEVQHPILGTVTATTHIPPIPRLTMTDTVQVQYKGRRVLQVTINLEGPFDQNSLFVFEGLKELMELRRYFFHNNLRYSYETAQGKAFYSQISHNQYVPIYTDTVSQNKFIRLNLYTEDIHTENARIDNLDNPFRRIFLSEIPAGSASYQIRIFVDPQFFVSTDATQKGRVRIQAKLVSKELYDYFLVYEKYKTDFGIVPSGQLISPTGNILGNGLGVFGGSAKRERIFYFDRF
ncbi:MAG: DUF4249 family protein [Chitinophagaceae bacterium]